MCGVKPVCRIHKLPLALRAGLCTDNQVIRLRGKGIRREGEREEWGNGKKENVQSVDILPLALRAMLGGNDQIIGWEIEETGRSKRGDDSYTLACF